MTPAGSLAATSPTETADPPASKRARILDVAQRLFADGGFDGVSMRDIANEAGVGLPLIVYHFKTKQNLYRALFERFEALLDARLAALRAPLAPGMDPLEHIARAFVLPVSEGTVLPGDIPGKAEYLVQFIVAGLRAGAGTGVGARTGSGRKRKSTGA